MCKDDVQNSFTCLIYCFLGLSLFSVFRFCVLLSQSDLISFGNNPQLVLV